MSTKLSVQKENSIIVKQLAELLEKGNAHVTLEGAVKDLPAELRSVKADKMPYTIWQLLEHIRITQWDILEFSSNPDHQSPVWPDEYWPKEGAPASEDAWKNSLHQIKNDRKDFIALLQRESDKLLMPFPYGDGQNLLREALLIADHTSYHTGEIVVLRRLLGAWKNS